MTWCRAAAALLALCAALLGGGCAMFKSAPDAANATGASGPNGAPSGEDPATTNRAAAAATAQAQSVGVEIDAPKDLKTLLERNLDLVRLGRLARDDVDTTEWSRLIDATPGQVRELLQTEGYFAPQVSLERTLAADPVATDPNAAAGSAAASGGQVRIRVVPGPQAHVSRVTIEAEGDLERAVQAGDAGARATLDQLRTHLGPARRQRLPQPGVEQRQVRRAGPPARGPATPPRCGAAPAPKSMPSTTPCGCSWSPTAGRCSVMASCRSKAWWRRTPTPWPIC